MPIITTAPKPTDAQPPRGEAAWQAWRDLATGLDHPSICRLRREVSARIEIDHPDLQELGSSDLNCYAVTYLECGLLVVRPDGGYRWSDEDLAAEEEQP